MQDKLEAKISDWLRTQGYPLEMKVASALRKEDFFCQPKPILHRPRTGTSREIDVIATKGDNVGFFRGGSRN